MFAIIKKIINGIAGNFKQSELSESPPTQQAKMNGKFVTIAPTASIQNTANIKSLLELAVTIINAIPEITHIK